MPKWGRNAVLFCVVSDAVLSFMYFFVIAVFFALCVLVMDNSMHTAVIGTPVDMDNHMDNRQWE